MCLTCTCAQALGPSGHPASLIRGRSASDQASLLQQLFLETDTTIAMDEGCTATVLLMEREDDGHVIVQVCVTHTHTHTHARTAHSQ